MKKDNRRWWAVPSAVIVAGVIVAPLLAIPLVSATATCADHWAFDEASAGDVVHDLGCSGANNAQPFNDGEGGAYPTPSTDIPAAVTFNDPYSISFDGTNYFELNRPVQDDFSICAWIKTSAVGNSVDHWESMPILDAEVPTLARDFSFGVDSNGMLMYGNGGDYDTTVNGATAVNDNTWHHACVTRDSTSGAVILYLDGTVDATGTTDLGAMADNASARIGWGFDGAAHWVGLMDDVRVYSTVLTVNEVANLAHGSGGADMLPDNDGIPAAIEAAAPNNGDANNDGIPDDQQANVASFVNGQSGKYTAVAVPDACTLSSVSSAANASGSAGDTGYSYPNGLINFTAACGVSGFTADVKLYIYGSTGTSFVLRKYNPTTHKYLTVSGATITHTTIGGQAVLVASYSIADGGSLDADGTANGVIVDPVGLALVGAPDTGYGQAAVSEAASLGLLLAGMFGAAIAVRRYPRARS